MINSMTMSGAELKTILTGLGLSPAFLAARVPGCRHAGSGELRPTTMRTVVNWFNEDVVQAKVEVEVNRLRQITYEEIESVFTDVPDDGPVVLRTYRTDDQLGGDFPASWHRALIYDVLESLRTEGREVSVAYE